MPDATRDRGTREPVSTTGLRLRFWIGCLGGALLGGAGVLGVAGTFIPVSGPVPAATVAVLPWALAALPLLAGFALALWLDRGIVGPLRDMSRALVATDPAVRRTLASRGAWGELGELSEWLHALLARLELAGREVQELRAGRQRLEATVDDLMVAIERWAIGELPGNADLERGPLVPLGRILERRAEREAGERARLRDDLLEVWNGVAQDVASAQEAVEHAERGFVEATALLSTLRELDRLGGELQLALAAGAEEGDPTPSQRESLERYRAAAAAAIEELVSASAASVERLAAGFRRVQEIADQVQVLGNRATLIALEAASRRGPGAAAAGRDDALQALAHDAQAATARTGELAQDVDRDVAAAIDAMRGLRERVADRLAQAPELPETSPSRPPSQAERLLERVREMVADGSEKGERLAASGERASSAVERLVRRLEVDARTIEDLAGRIERGSPEGE